MYFAATAPTKSRLNPLLAMLFSLVIFSMPFELRAAHEQYIPQPSDSISQKWVNKYFEAEEVWRIADLATYLQLLNATVADEPLKKKLAGLFQDSLSRKEIDRLMGQYVLDGSGGFVVIPEEIRAQVPPQLLEAIHEHQFDKLHISPSLFIKMDTRKEALDTIEKIFKGPAAEKMKNNIIQFREKHLILITPENWNVLPEYLRKMLVKSSLALGDTNIGIKVNLTLHRGDNLAAIARKYAGERDYRPIERFLRKTLGAADSAEIPLEKIMHPFIRRMMSLYSECHGPNCFNAGLNVNRSHSHKIELTSPKTLLSEAYSKYRFVSPSENLQAGDLLMYLNSSSQPVHVATYVADGVVFTKNGSGRESPYIFQKMPTTENVYFPDGKFLLQVFRIPEPGENPVSRDGKYQGMPVLYRHSPGKGGVPEMQGAECAREYGNL